MKNITTLQCKRSITAFLGVLLYFSSLSAQTMQDTIIAHFSLMERIPKAQKKSYTCIWKSLSMEPERKSGSKDIW